MYNEEPELHVPGEYVEETVARVPVLRAFEIGHVEKDPKGQNALLPLLAWGEAVVVAWIW